MGPQRLESDDSTSVSSMATLNKLPFHDVMRFVADHSLAPSGPPAGRARRAPIRMSIQGGMPKTEDSFVAMGTAPVITSLVEQRVFELQAATTRGKAPTWFKCEYRDFITHKWSQNI